MKDKNSMKKAAVVVAALSFCLCGPARGAGFSWNQYASKPDDWYRGQQAKRIAENVLSWQDDEGGWPKNTDTAAVPFSGDRKGLHGTFDNQATTGEMRFLARAFRATREARYQESFLKALDLIVKAQYPTGGWPQYYPPGKGYARHITFNDGAMVRLMELLKEIACAPEYDFVYAGRRAAAQNAFDRGIDCILKCQIQVDGKLTVWCAQHDEIDYSPRPARSYELASLSGGESAGILRLLMKLDNPSPEVIRAITAGVDWYKDAAVKGIRVESVDGKMRAVRDPDAPPLWGRFCEIQTNRPFFCDRDGVPKYDFNQIDPERSTGYRWYGDWGRGVFREHEKWQQRWAGRFVPAGAKVPASR